VNIVSAVRLEVEVGAGQSGETEVLVGIETEGNIVLSRGMSLQAGRGEIPPLFQLPVDREAGLLSRLLHRAVGEVLPKTRDLRLQRLLACYERGYLTR
jgi:hypothetical protein